MASRIPYPFASVRHGTHGAPSDTLGADALRDWQGVIRSHRLTLEHAAVDIDTVETDRVIYRLELELDTPLPASALQYTQLLALTWPFGGLWRIEYVGEASVTCISWRKTELSKDQIAWLAREVDELAQVAQAQQRQRDAALFHGDDTAYNATQDVLSTHPTLFQWKAMRGEYNGADSHWFIRDVQPPMIPFSVPTPRSLIAKLFVGFQPLEARIDINAVTAIDTVAQTYSADVTWQVTLPGITALRSDSALLELLDVLEIDASQFEFTNVNDMRGEPPVVSSMTFAGEVQFQDLTQLGAHPTVVEYVYHLHFRRRVVASFTEEMALHHFPFDQQKLAFNLSTGIGGMPDEHVRLTPAPVNPGSFSIDDFQLGNVFDVAYHNKVFVCEIQESGPKKSMRFEMVVERRSEYYLTNLALIACIITYLCFITWAPLPGGEFMDSGSRLQVVTALVLTAVTFKNQVASVIPQVSYFSMLDKYVFVCFLVTCLVTLENAFFPLVNDWFSDSQWDEQWLLSFSAGAFTLLNVCWALFIRMWLKRRLFAAQVLEQVHGYIKVLTEGIPAKYREGVLRKFLERKDFPKWSVPKVAVTSNGHLHVQAPDDRPKSFESQKNRAMNRLASLAHLQTTSSELLQFKDIMTEIRPELDRHESAPSPRAPQILRRHMIMHKVGHALNARLRRRGSLRASLASEGTPNELLSDKTGRPVSDTFLDVTPFHRHHDADERTRSL